MLGITNDFPLHYLRVIYLRQMFQNLTTINQNYLSGAAELELSE